MSKMTLDEAIQHCDYVADSDYYDYGTAQMACAEEHRQLADWLRELKMLREEKERLFDDRK